MMFTSMLNRLSAPPRWLPILFLMGVGFHPVMGHVGNHPSLHDTVAGVADRMKETLREDQLRQMTAFDVEQFLTDEERHILSEEHIRFQISTPVTMMILRDRSLKSEPFWLRETFQLTGRIVKVGGVEMDVWERDFKAGEIGLGINSLSGGGRHYLIFLKPADPEETLVVEDLYPGTLRMTAAQEDLQPYVDRDIKLSGLPPELEGSFCIQTEDDSRNDAKLIDLFRWTRHPAGNRPDHLTLTWSDDPKTTQTIQWRTSTEVAAGRVAYQKQSLYHRFQPAPLDHVDATTEVLESPNVINDPVIHRHTATLRNLEPGATYVYSVGDGTEDGWSELSEFTTAPDRTVPFSFIYMGDAQNGLDRWGTLVRNAFRERPDAAFYLMAGDLVNRGNDRDDWDSFFENARTVFDRRTLVPVIGNHENQGGHPTLYLKQFRLLENGPANIEKERAYAFEFSNALFVVLDSNLDAESQAPWLDSVLKDSPATWKFVTYHHPAYSSAPNRDNQAIREHWVPLFDKYHVDLVLQGHDHAYLRTFPMKANQPVDSPKEGTVYIVSVSGTKMYSQADRDYTEVGMTNISTYQVLDLQVSGDRLVYRAYDIDGNLKDDFVIEK